MAYASVDDLAGALRVLVSPANTQILTDCLEAAADEIDAALDRVDPLPDPPPTSVKRANINRAVEWYKATDAVNGQLGVDQSGVIIPVHPGDGFARHALTIVHLKQQWGLA